MFKISLTFPNIFNGCFSKLELVFKDFLVCRVLLLCSFVPLPLSKSEPAVCTFKIRQRLKQHSPNETEKCFSRAAAAAAAVVVAAEWNDDKIEHRSRLQLRQAGRSVRDEQRHSLLQ